MFVSDHQKRATKLSVITSIHLPTQELLKYLQEYALILRVEKLYRVHPVNGKERNYLTLV